MYDMLEKFKTRINIATQNALDEFETEFNRRYSVMRGDEAKSPKAAAHGAIEIALGKLELQPEFQPEIAPESEDVS